MGGRFVLFDFDGVIADSFELAYDVARKVHHEVSFTSDVYRGWFEGNIYDTTKHLESYARRGVFNKLYAARLDTEVSLVFGMDEVVRRLADEYTLVIVSSTESSHIQFLLNKYGIAEHITGVMGADVHTNKAEKIRMLFDLHGLSSNECVFVTDTLGDIREAKAHEVGSIGVSWGWHTHETLERGIPFRIVDAPAELSDAICDYFARSQ